MLYMDFLKRENEFQTGIQFKTKDTTSITGIQFRTKDTTSINENISSIVNKEYYRRNE